MSFIKRKENLEKKPSFISEEPIVLNVDIDRLEVRVKKEGVEVGFAKVLRPAMDDGKKSCKIEYFEKYLPISGIGRMMLSEMITIAKNSGATRIVVYPNPVDLQIEEMPPLTIDALYTIYEKLGFKFDGGKADSEIDRNVTNNKMYLEI